MSARLSLLFISLSCILSAFISLWLFEVNASRTEPIKDPETRFNYIRTDESQDDLNKEKALLLDSEPLFRPTFWNATIYSDLVKAPEDALPVFDDYPVALSLGEEALFPPSMQIEQPELSFFYKRSFWDKWRALGENSASDFEKTPSFLRVEVRRLSSNELVMELKHPLDSSNRSDTLIAPATFLIKNWSGRQVGPAVMLSSSGSGDWDQSLKEKLPELLSSMDLQGEFIVVAGL